MKINAVILDHQKTSILKVEIVILYTGTNEMTPRSHVDRGNKTGCFVRLENFKLTHLRAVKITYPARIY